MVDLPLPLGPTRAIVFPASVLRLTWSRTCHGHKTVVVPTNKRKGWHMFVSESIHIETQFVSFVIGNTIASTNNCFATIYYMSYSDVYASVCVCILMYMWMFVLVCVCVSVCVCVGEWVRACVRVCSCVMQYLYFRSRFIYKVDPFECNVSYQFLRPETAFWTTINLRFLQTKRSPWFTSMQGQTVTFTS